jgi:hypothetical protein
MQANGQIMKNGHTKIKSHAGRKEKAAKRTETNGRMDIPELRSPLERRAGQTMELVVITPAVLKQWKLPPFQRPLRMNKQFHLVVEEIKKDSGIVPGTLTLGVFEDVLYVVDGQHRLEALKLAMDNGTREGLAECRIKHFDSMTEMAEEYVNINQSIAKMGPDDVLRGMESSIEALGIIRKRCEFVGYDNVRRGPKASAIVSMSSLLRMWHAAIKDTPSASGGGSALSMALSLSNDEANLCCDFLLICERAWGRDAAYWKLWGALNLSLCAWLYRRTVLAAYSGRSARLTKEQFRACAQTLSAHEPYMEYIVGRTLSERDRSPCFDRIKTIFVRRMATETGKRIALPAPPWAPGHSRSAR